MLAEILQFFKQHSKNGSLWNENFLFTFFKVLFFLFTVFPFIQPHRFVIAQESG